MVGVATGENYDQISLLHLFCANSTLINLTLGFSLLICVGLKPRDLAFSKAFCIIVSVGLAIIVIFIFIFRILEVVFQIDVVRMMMLT